MTDPLRDADSKDRASHAEATLLRWLCSSHVNPGDRHRIAQKLAAHRCGDTHRQVLAECLAALPPAPIANLHAEIVSRLTRSGFPDMNLDLYFEPDQSYPELDAIEELLASLSRPSAR